MSVATVAVKVTVAVLPASMVIFAPTGLERSLFLVAFSTFITFKSVNLSASVKRSVTSIVRSHSPVFSTVTAYSTTSPLTKPYLSVVPGLSFASVIRSFCMV